MHRIISPTKGLEFVYQSEFNRAFFEVWIVTLGWRQRKAIKLPLGVSDAELTARVGPLVQPRPADAAPISAEQALQHCHLYQRNVYYLYTLLHEPRMHAFVSWLQEWYARHFLASLTALLLELPNASQGPVAEQLQAADSAMAVSVGTLLQQIRAAATPVA